MIEAAKYSISVRLGEFEGEQCFEARVKELHDIAEYADSWQEAYELAVDAIETTAVAFAERGRSMPEPAVSNDNYSGRVTLRIPRSLHHSLAAMADRESVSLNHLMVSVLASFRGFDAGLGDAHAEWVNAFETGEKQQPLHGVKNVVSISRHKKYESQTAANW